MHKLHIDSSRLYMQVLQFDFISWEGLLLPLPCEIARIRWTMRNLNFLEAIIEIVGMGSRSSS